MSHGRASVHLLRTLLFIGYELNSGSMWILNVFFFFPWLLLLFFEPCIFYVSFRNILDFLIIYFSCRYHVTMVFFWGIFLKNIYILGVFQKIILSFIFFIIFFNLKNS
ncbi:unnamed protein product [Musa acuminata var. zebrina]